MCSLTLPLFLDENHRNYFVPKICQTVDAIARTGMKVVLCTREDTEQVRCAVNQLHSGSFVNESKIRIQPMDLSDLSSIETAVAQIARTEGKIDVVLNCAGVNSVPFKQLTAQNFEMQLGVLSFDSFSILLL